MLNYMTKSDFDGLLQGPRGHYYTGRWEYFKEVMTIVKSMDISRVLEIGPGFIPIVKNAQIMLNPLEDQFGWPETEKVTVYDATRRNWPFNDKEFDLVIALQVWEHLDGKQTRAFREVIRIARMALFSFPYLWEGGIEDKPSHRAHRDIDKELIGDWTLHIKPAQVIEIQRTGEEFSKGKRLIYFWEF